MQSLLHIARSLAVAAGISAALYSCRIARTRYSAARRHARHAGPTGATDPGLLHSTSGPIGQVTTKVYEGLLRYDFNLQPVPGLAQSWTVSPDGKTITFKLQKGVKFHDGSHSRARTCKFSHSRGAEEGASRAVSTPSAKSSDRHARRAHGDLPPAEPAPYC